jgi:hypothetical protein
MRCPDLYKTNESMLENFDHLIGRHDDGFECRVCNVHTVTSLAKLLDNVGVHLSLGIGLMEIVQPLSLDEFRSGTCGKL